MRNQLIFLSIFGTFLLTAAQIPLQYEREHGFPFGHNNGPQLKSGVLKSFTKARLPENNVKPLNYTLMITPVLDAGLPNNPLYTAPGKVTIRVEPRVAALKVITLNSVGLNITDSSVKVTPVGEAELAITNKTTDVQTEFYVIELQDELELDKQYDIYIEFVAPVETNQSRLNGLYLSTYSKPNGNISRIATTQFEATAARQAFPCFDEPWIKATYKVSIGHHSKYNAYGNGERIESDTPTPHPDPEFIDYLLSDFEETVVMSSYLIAMIVAEFSCHADDSGAYSKPARICGPPHLIDEQNGGDYPAQKSAEILNFFEKHYEIDYKMGKMDSVAVNDFEFGAMENYGLNIYREPYLLYFDGVSTETERQRITIILAHELAHQWFGNLVTTKFWNFIWLNEGFATYNEFLAGNAVAPEFEPLSIRQNDAFQEAMIYDANFEATHPLVNAANGNYTNAELMGGIFDRITYEKGGSLIRMMEGFLGGETFRQGLIKYLNKMSFQGAEQDDLFSSLTEQAHEDGKLPVDVTVKDIMDTWSLQTGFPLVRVSKASDSMIYVSQERFTPDVKYTENSGLDPNELWEIPVAVATSENNDFTNHTPAFWLGKGIALKTASFDTTKWILVNTDSVGFFRVLYDMPLFDLLAEQLVTDHKVIGEKSRSQLLDDYFTLAANKFTDIENAFELTKYLEHEDKIVVWNTVFRHLRPIYNKLLGTGTLGDFKNYFVPRLESVLGILGLEQRPAHNGTNVILRTQLLDWACALEHVACREYASRLFSEWNATPEPNTNPVPVDIRQVMYCGAVAHGGDDAFQKAMDKYSADTTTAKDKPMLLNALACVTDLPNLLVLQAEILSETSKLSSVPDKIKTLQNLGANPQSRQMAIGFVRERYEELIEKLDSASIIVSFIETLSTYVSSETDLENVQDIITKTDSHMLEPQKAKLATLVGTINNNIKWMTEYEARLKTWFSSNA